MKHSLLKSALVAIVAAMATNVSAQDGYKYDSDCNMFKRCAYTVDSWLAEWGSWNTSSESISYAQEGTTTTVTIPVATDGQWKAQFRFKTDMATNSATHYSFSVKLKSNVNLSGVTLKEDTGSLYDTRVDLTADEESVVVLEDLAGKDIEGLQVLFDFGGNPDNTVVTISDVVLREKDCDDDTYVYVEPEVGLNIGDAAFEKISNTQLEFKGKLVQGKVYEFDGASVEDVTAADFYYNPDYFVKNDNGTYTFIAVDGEYNITANLSKKFFFIYPLDAEGNAANYGNGKALYVIGSNGIGKPSFASNPSNWGGNLATSISAAQVEEGVYRLTLTVGKQLNGSNVNFKFFEQAGWGGEIKSDRIQIAEGKGDDLFFVGNGSNGADDGNIVAASGATFTDGDTYTLTFNINEGQLTAEKAETEGGVPTAIKSVNTVESNSNSEAYYNLNGQRVATPKAGIYVHNGKKVVVK